MYNPFFYFADADVMGGFFKLFILCFIIWCVGYFLNLALPMFYTGFIWLCVGSSALLLVSWWSNRPAREACELLVYGDDTFLNRFSFADKLASIFFPILLGGFSKSTILISWLLLCVVASLSGRVPVDRYGKPGTCFGEVDHSPRSSIYSSPLRLLSSAWAFLVLGGLVWFGTAFLLQAFFKNQPDQNSYILLAQWFGLIVLVTIVEMIAGHARRIRVVWANSVPEREALVRAELMKAGIAAPAPEVVHERIRQRWGLAGDQRLPFGFILDFAVSMHGLADGIFQVLGMLATWPVLMLTNLGVGLAARDQEIATENARARQMGYARRFGS